MAQVRKSACHQQRTFLSHFFWNRVRTHTNCFFDGPRDDGGGACVCVLVGWLAHTQTTMANQFHSLYDNLRSVMKTFNYITFECHRLKLSRECALPSTKTTRRARKIAAKIVYIHILRWNDSLVIRIMRDDDDVGLAWCAAIGPMCASSA